MKHNWFTRILSSLLVMAMMLQLFPAGVFATEEQETVVSLVIPEGQPSNQIMGEEISLRSEDTKHFRLNDGTFLAVNYGLPVHYQDEDGSWQDINNTPIMAMGLEDSNYQIANGDNTLSFAQNLENGSLITASQGTASVSMSLLDTVQAQTLTGEPVTYAAKSMSYSRTSSAALTQDDSSTITARDGFWNMEDIMPQNLQSSVLYQNVYPGVDLLYTAYSYNVKEQIIVKAPQSSYRYDFLLELNGLTAIENTDGSISLLNAQQQTVYTIPAPFMVDANDAVSYAVTYGLTVTENGTVLTVVADESWIDQEDRAYPVSIDPSLVVSSGKYQEDIYSVYTMEESTKTPTFGYQYLYCGSSYTGGEYRIYMHINELPELPKNATLTDVSLNLYMHIFGHRSMPDLPLGVYEVDVEKPSQYATYRDWFAGICWNNQPDYVSNRVIDYTNASSSKKGSYLSFELTELAREWYADNTTNTTIALAATNLENHSTASLAYASFYAYASYYPPTVFVSYRNTTGIEPYYTYTTLSAGSAGAAYIADATGQLKAVKGLVGYASGVNPFTMSLTYNSDYCISENTAHFPAEDLGLSMKLGPGWNLNCVQKVEPETIGNTQYLKYTDGDGTVHYFTKNSAMDSTKTYYYDEDGLGLKIKSTGENSYQMSDDRNNFWNFTGSYLTSTQNADGNEILLTYTEQKLTSVTQKNKDGQEISIATLSYDDSNTLKTITNAAGIVYEFIYTGENLTGIKRGSVNIAQYCYNGCRLTGMTDVESGYTLSFTYTDGKVSTYQEVCGDTTGNAVDISYEEGIRTVHRDYGSDRTAGSADDILTYYLFDYAGRTANAYTTDAGGKIIGASNAVYSGTGTTDKTNNRTLRTASIGMAAQHLMSCTGVETDGWTLNSMTYDTATTRTGNRSLKGSGTVIASISSASLTAGKTYTFSGYVNTAGFASGNTGSVYLQVTKGSTSWDSQKVDYPTLVTVDGGWMRLSVTFTAGASGSYTLRVLGDNVSGSIYADDFQLEEGQAPSSYNLVENGGMEQSSHGWTFGNGASMAATGANSSSASIQIIGNPADPLTNAYQDIPLNLPGSQSYVLSGWFKGNAVPDTENKADDPANDTYKQCGLRAELTYADDTKEYHYVPFNTDLTDWQFASIAVVPKEVSKTVKSIRVYCAYERNANVGCFDNISLVREAAQTMKYDEDGNLICVNTTGLSEDVDTYENGNLIKTVTGGSGTYEYTYDTTYKHRLLSVTDGHVRQAMTYDQYGNVTGTELTQAGDNVTTPKISSSVQYSADGNRLVSSTDASGNITSYSYDTSWSVMTGTPTKVQNANGVESYSQYDDFGRVTGSMVKNSCTFVDGIANLEYTYSNGQLSTVTRTDLSGNHIQTYNFTYDGFGNMTQLKVGSKLLASYTYAPRNGLLTTQTYANGDVVSFEYDDFGRTTKTTYSDGRILTYTYAGDGGLHSIHDSVTNETTSYTRDSLGRLISSRGEGEKATQYSYDENNRLTRWVYTIPTLSRTAMHYTYNTDTADTIPDGLLTGVTMFDGGSISYSYDYLQRISNRNIAGKLEERYAYAPGAGENTTTTRVSTKHNLWNGSLINQFQYSYDSLGNITSVCDAHTGKRVSYTYDDQGQLLTATHTDNDTVTRTEVYTYDNVGNILTFNNGTTSHSYTYGDSDWKDLLTAVDGNAITYDASGNPTSYYNGYTMTWVEGRKLDTVTVNGQTYTYVYNSDGQRVKKINPDGSYIEYYVMDGTTVGESHFTATGNKTLGIRYTLDENTNVIGFTMNGVNYYFAKNLQGDVLAVYNATTNELVAQYTYDSWGNILSATGTLEEINPFRYRGYYYDEETNFYYLQSRYYNAGIGRFINADSYASTGQAILGSNMFAYCLNNPVLFMDPIGLRAMINARIDYLGKNHYSYGEGHCKELMDYVRAENSELCNYPNYTMTVIYNGILYKQTDHSIEYAYYIFDEIAKSLILYGISKIPLKIIGTLKKYEPYVGFIDGLVSLRSIHEVEDFDDDWYDTYTVTMSWTDIYKWNGGTTYTYYLYSFVFCLDKTEDNPMYWRHYLSIDQTITEVVYD